VISGTAQEGQTLTATAAVANDADASVHYQWQASHGSGFVNIAGATSLTYVVTATDEGAQLHLVATSTDSDGSGTTATSAATATVPHFAVSVTGKAQEGQTLTATANGVVSSYQWQALIGATWTNIAGATASTYAVPEAVEGEKLRVAATPAGGSVANSAATKAVVDVTPTLSVTLTGTAQEGQTLTLTPTLTTDADGGTSAYQWQAKIGTVWTNIAGATGTTYTVAEADEGHQLRATATFTDDTAHTVTANSTATAAVTDAPPSLTIASNALTVAAGGSVAMGVSVSTPDADDTVSVKITGLKSYEHITDALDGNSFSGASVTLTAAETNSGLTLFSTYGGTGHPVNTLTLTASNTTAGETISAAAQTIAVTDPPAGGAFQQVALLTQYMAALGGDGSSSLNSSWAPPPLAHPDLILSPPAH
jgi:hypothetical protein